TGTGTGTGTGTESSHPNRDSLVFLPRPPTGLDMVPRTSRTRRVPVEEDPPLSTIVSPSRLSSLSSTSPSSPSSPAADYPYTSTIDRTLPPIAVTQASTVSNTSDAMDTHENDGSTTRAGTPSSSARAGVGAEGAGGSHLGSSLPRPSISESRTNEEFYIQRPLTMAQRRILTQREYLKKFMCIVATMPIIATLAVYNKIELVMWWVIVVPLLGIGIALVWRRHLGRKLERLDLEASQISLPIDRDSTTRVTRHNHEPGEEEVSPPPDYQSSIITPPAYIVAPRKVPSYRSLENLFSFGRSDSRRQAAVAAANAADAAEDAAASTSASASASASASSSASTSAAAAVATATISGPSSAITDVVPPSQQEQQEQQRRPSNTSEDIGHVQETPVQPITHDTTSQTLPEMREIGPGFGECTIRVLDTVSHTVSSSSLSDKDQARQQSHSPYPKEVQSDEMESQVLDLAISTRNCKQVQGKGQGSMDELVIQLDHGDEVAEGSSSEQPSTAWRSIVHEVEVPPRDLKGKRPAGI
ncbi:hypothetical protein BGZ94_003385, partial [Podila epigama]